MKRLADDREVEGAGERRKKIDRAAGPAIFGIGYERTRYEYNTTIKFLKIENNKSSLMNYSTVSCH